MELHAPEQLRLPSGTWTPIIGWTLLAALSIDALVRGRWDVIVGYSPGIVLVAWLLYVAFWAPRVVVARAGVSVVNMWTTTFVPWARLVDVSIGLTVKLTYRDNAGAEKKVSAWNAPGVPKLPSQLRRGDAGKEHTLGVESSPSQIIVDQWIRHESDPEAPVAKTPNWVAIIGIVLTSAWATWALLT